MKSKTTVKVATIGTAVVGFGFLVGAFFNTLNQTNTTRGLIKAYDDRFQTYLIADELRQTSDDLTRMARTYAVTGDQRFLDYFNEILDIRSGEAPRPLEYADIYWDLVTSLHERPRAYGEAISLRQMMEAAGFTSNEFELVTESENKSDKLAVLEGRALDVMKEPDGQSLAQELLYSSEYHFHKAQIMQPLLDLAHTTSDRMDGEVEQQQLRQAGLVAELKIYLVVSIVFFILSALIAFFGRTREGD